jgi:hypothetical protein
MVATDWAIAGDTTPHPIVSASSSQPLLKVYADHRPDHILSLLVLNEDPANAYATTMTLAGFSPQTTAYGWTFDPTHYAWDTTSVPYHANPDTPPSPVIVTGISSSFPVTFQPYSLTVLQLADINFSTATPTPTPTQTNTLTASPAPSMTGTATRTVTSSPTPTSTPSTTSTSTSSPTSTATPLSQSGIIFPNPWDGRVPLSLYHTVDQTLDSVRMKIYTTALRKIYEDDSLASSAGQHLYSLAWGKAGNLSNGLYYLVVDEIKSGKDHDRIYKLLILR